MPYKDKEKRNARQREHYREILEADPEYRAKRTAQAKALHDKKMAADERYREKVRADYKRWYDLYGKENARERRGTLSFEEYSEQCTAKRKAHAEYMAAWNKTEAGQKHRTARSIKKRCGLSIEEYDATYDVQEGNCRICGSHKERYGKDRLVVDHCHKTGKFRALLCSKCNCAIGLFEENEEIALRAIAYLREVTGPLESLPNNDLSVQN